MSGTAQSDVQAISPLPPRSLDKVDVILDSLSSSSLPKEMTLLLGFTTWELFSLSECDHMESYAHNETEIMKLHGSRDQTRLPLPFLCYYSAGEGNSPFLSPEPENSPL